MHIKHLFLAALFMSLPCLPAPAAEIPADKRQEIEKLLRLTGTEARVTQMASLMIANMKSKMTDVPAEYWTKFEKKINSRDLIDKVVPLYDKYFSLADLKAINVFYESAAGQRILSSMPLIMQEAMKVGMEWGEGIAKQVVEETAKPSKTTP